MPRVSIRVRPTDASGRMTSGAADSAPWAHIVGKLSHLFKVFDLPASTIAALEKTGVFEIVPGWRSPQGQPTWNVSTSRGRAGERLVRLGSLAHGGA